MPLRLDYTFPYLKRAYTIQGEQKKTGRSERIRMRVRVQDLSTVTPKSSELNPHVGSTSLGFPKSKPFPGVCVFTRTYVSIIRPAPLSRLVFLDSNKAGAHCHISFRPIAPYECNARAFGKVGLGSNDQAYNSYKGQKTYWMCQGPCALSEY